MRVSVTQRRAIKVRIYPTEEQAVFFQKNFGCCRFVWNQMLMDESDFYYATDKHFVPTSAKYKKQFPFLKEVDSLALANTQIDLNQAFKRFFKEPGKVGHPKLKTKKKSRKSYTTNCHYNKRGVHPTVEAIGYKGVRLPKIGIVKANIHRAPMPGWKLKTATVSQSPTGKYYCSLGYEHEEDQPEEVLPTEERTIGLDYSSPLFYVDDQGNDPGRPQYYRDSEDRLKFLQKRLARRQKGSNGYMETLQQIRKLHEHIANQRRDFNQKLSRRITNSWDAVCIEDLDMRSIARSLKLGKSTYDNGWGGFREMLRYKLEEQGKHLIIIDRWFPSSKTCHECGYVNKDLTLKDRVWVCPNCGKIVERDANAGKNIKAEGLRKFYAERETETVATL